MKVGIIIDEKMKRISILLLTVATALPSVAQLSGDGFYRIQNAQSERYATVVDNKAENKEITSTSNVDLYAINTKNLNEVMSDPGSLFYIEKGSNGYILRGQGMDTYKLTNMYLRIRSSNEIAGAYYLYGSDSGITRFLKESDNKYKAFGFYYVATAADWKNESCSWNIIPVKNTGDQYLGLKTDIEAGGKYYSTFYTSFDYQMSKGMKAYYIRQCNGKMAEMIEIEGNIVPGNTPVIIECSSNKTADNKITPIKGKSTGINQNQLKGIFFCNVIKWAMDGEEEKDFFNWNTTNYDATTMRVLGKVNGKLAFVKAEDLTYLPANKAYLMVNSSADANIELVGTDKYPSGINDLKTEKNTNKNSIYSLAGVKLQNTTSTEDLPAGVYIVNGKKITVK